MENLQKVKWYYSIFKNGKYLDLWSVNHTLAGVVIAGPLYYFSVSFTSSFLIALILIVGWEIFEVIFDIYETWQNKSTDVITGVIGFLLVWHYFSYLSFNCQMGIYLLSLTIFIILEIWGYLAYRAGVQ